jgi:16S rRNA (uracil1498-N3)-methyltransferase
MGPGDEVAGVDGAGNRYRLRMERVDSGKCVVSVLAAAGEEVADCPQITLFQCLPKGSKTDLIVRQATEAGVARIVPLISRHSIPRIDDARTEEKKRQRWLRVAREAVQQSGTPRIPEIVAPIPFDRLGEKFACNRDSVGIFFHQEPLEQRTLHGYLSANPQRVAIVVGPEGGLAESEIDHLRQLGFGAAYLGSRVLRTETAALYAIAAVQIVLLEKKTWRIN